MAKKNEMRIVEPKVYSNYTILNSSGKMQSFPDGRLITTIDSNNYMILQKVADQEMFDGLVKNLTTPNEFFENYFATAIFKVLTEYSYFELENLSLLYYKASISGRDEARKLISVVSTCAAKLQDYIDFKMMYGLDDDHNTTQIVKINMGGFTKLAYEYERDCDEIRESEVSSLDKQTQIGCLRYNLEFLDSLNLEKRVSKFNYNLVTNYYILEKEKADAYIEISFNIAKLNRDANSEVIDQDMMYGVVHQMHEAFKIYEEYDNVK